MSSEAAAFQHVAVIGAGSFGSALALLLHGQKLRVTVWGHDPEMIARVSKERANPTYLPGAQFPPELKFTAEMQDLSGADLVLLVTPSRAIREVMPRLQTAPLAADAAFLSCIKGVERGTGLRMSEIIAEHFPQNHVGVLSGPSHAEELARKKPAAVVVGCRDEETNLRLQRAFSCRYLRAYTSDDVAGIELGGALKNIYALAAGVSDGLGLGDNSKASLVTRALAEMVPIGMALGGRRETFFGLSGVGDLMVTCFSQHSRNRAVGERLGRGEKIGEIIGSMAMVAEGVPTTYSAWECAQKFGVDAPIIQQMHAVLEGQVSAPEALAILLGRDPKPEVS
jgi:glycerol-3-phosphate dehydrogenase (NAD(P)+)